MQRGEGNAMPGVAAVTRSSVVVQSPHCTFERKIVTRRDTDIVLFAAITLEQLMNKKLSPDVVGCDAAALKPFKGK